MSKTFDVIVVEASVTNRAKPVLNYEYKSVKGLVTVLTNMIEDGRVDTINIRIIGRCKPKPKNFVPLTE